MKPLTQNGVYRMIDVAILTYFLAFALLCLADFFFDAAASMAAYVTFFIVFGVFFCEIYFCFKEKKRLQKAGQWAKLSFREQVDFHWWRKGAAD